MPINYQFDFNGDLNKLPPTDRVIDVMKFDSIVTKMYMLYLFAFLLERLFYQNCRNHRNAK